MSKKRGLNQGRVDMLLSDALGLARSKESVEVEQAIAAPAKKALREENAVAADIISSTQAILQQIPLTKLMPGQFQPRKNMPEVELQELAASIKENGVLQPLVVRAKGAKFEIIAGERRWRAAGFAGLQTVPAVVHDISDKEAMIVGLVENIQREDLNPLEEAYALERLITEFGFTHEETAKAVGKSRTVISNLLRLLQLTPEVKKMLAAGSIDLGHAKVLLAVEGKEQGRLAKIVAEQDLSVRETERLLQRELKPVAQQKTARPLDPDIARLQRSLAEKVGAPVRIMHSVKGRGKIVIKYNSIDELDGILEHII